MVTRAWEATCKANSGTVRDRVARELWYRGELIECLGKDSTKTASQTRDFERVMSHFEAILGDSIYWQMQAFRGDAKRIVHEISAICENSGLDEDYLRGIARQALRFEAPPQLIDLSPDQLLIILRAARIHARRIRRDQELAAAFNAEPDPTVHLVHQVHSVHPVEISDENPF